MELHGNLTALNDVNNHSVILSWGQNLENHAAEETDENGETVLSAISVKKPVKAILFVDDEEPVRDLFKGALEKFGYQVTVASDGNEAISQFNQQPTDLIITDLFMPNKDGQTVIVEIMKKFPGTKIFAITGKDTIMGIETELEIAKSLGAIRGFAKPIKLSKLLDAIKEL